MAEAITFVVFDQAVKGSDRTSFVIQIQKRARHGPDNGLKRPQKAKNGGTRTATRVKYPLFNRFPVPLMTWDRRGTALGQAGQAGTGGLPSWQIFAGTLVQEQR